MNECDCDERTETIINSYRLFEELKAFFDEQVKKGVFEDVQVTLPCYIGYDAYGKEYPWFADKWYRCKSCGTLWEFQYPDFPATGNIRKFKDGIYHMID